ncbi:sterol carrier protein domain-containing protein [Nonomuraea sp. NPDC052265]|uniref:sterol carrier protein domain-containing protein n=1 Tax=Nonomuraea sp. NPDC052265 TaxID=3364374 RepID=UPI0037C9730F
MNYHTPHPGSRNVQDASNSGGAPCAAHGGALLHERGVHGEWNAGRHHLRADGDSVTCERTRARPDLRLTAAELGAAHLGGITLSSLAAAGRVEEPRPGAVGAASLAFRGERAPFHPSGWAFPAF